MEYNMHGCLAFAALCSRSQPRSCLRSLALAAVPLHPRFVSTHVIVDGWLPEQPVVLGRH